MLVPARAALAAVLLAAPLAVAPVAPAAAQDAPARFVPSTGRVTLVGSGEQSNSVVGPSRSSLRAGSSRATAGGARFLVTYTGFSTVQRDAFQAAVDTWSQLLSSPVPIRIDARLSRLPSGVLGAAAPTGYIVQDENNRYGPEDTLLPVALANGIAGEDLAPDDADIDAEFADDTALFSYGVDPEPGRYDFTTVVLHEIAHGLGFGGAMEVLTDSAGTRRGYWNTGTAEPRPLQFDRFTGTPLADGSITPLLQVQRGSQALGTALTSGRSVWTGAAGTAANGGVPPELYTPTVWEPGSSYSHLDEDLYPTGAADSLMTPTLDLGEVIRDPGRIALGMLQDMGWGADTSPLRLTAPTSAPAGSRVLISGIAPGGSRVALYFKKRGSTETSPGAQPGYVLQRELIAAPDGSFSTTYVANDDYRYYAVAGELTSAGMLTQVRPTISGAAQRRVPRGSTVSLAGRSLPGTLLSLRYTRGTEVDVTRTVLVAEDGTWFRNQVLQGDLRVYVTASNGQRSDGTTLLQVR